MALPQIAGYPNFTGIKDREVVHQLKLIWDQLIALSLGESELSGRIPTLGALPADVTNLEQLQQTLSRTVTSLGSTVSGLTAADIANVPAGDIAATDVQAALDELDSEKMPIDPPGGWLSRAAQSIGNNSLTKITANVANEDNDSICDTVNSKLLCNTPGVYRIWSVVQFAADADGVRYSVVKLNNTSYLDYDLDFYGNSGLSTFTHNVLEYRLAATDYLEIYVYHTAGAALNVTLYQFGMQWVRP